MDLAGQLETVDKLIMLTEKQVKSVIEEALLPLRCDTRFNHYDRNITFRVSESNSVTVVNMKRLNITLAKNEPFLKGTLYVVRDLVEERGYFLASWPTVNG